MNCLNAASHSVKDKVRFIGFLGNPGAPEPLSGLLLPCIQACTKLTHCLREVFARTIHGHIDYCDLHGSRGDCLILLKEETDLKASGNEKSLTFSQILPFNLYNLLFLKCHKYYIPQQIVSLNRKRENTMKQFFFKVRYYLDNCEVGYYFTTPCAQKCKLLN